MIKIDKRWGVSKMNTTAPMYFDTYEEAKKEAMNKAARDYGTDEIWYILEPVAAFKAKGPPIIDVEQLKVQEIKKKG